MTLGEQVWPQVRPVTVLVPLGAFEQHGPHLPLDTDTRLAAAVAARAAAEDGSLAVAAPLAYGASGEHEGFPGTLSIGHEALHIVLVELGRSALRWARRVVFVNWHGGNIPTVPAAVTRLRAEGRDAAWVACGVRGGDAHAGHTETALLLALHPELVRLDAAEPGNPAPLAELLPELRAGGVAAVSPNGVLGDPTGATAETGARYLAELAEQVRGRIARWQPRDDGRL